MASRPFAPEASDFIHERHTSAGSAVDQESMTFAKAAPTNTMIPRLVTFDESGGDRLLGEYTFNHTRSWSELTPSTKVSTVRVSPLEKPMSLIG